MVHSGQDLCSYAQGRIIAELTPGWWEKTTGLLQTRSLVLAGSLLFLISVARYFCILYLELKASYYANGGGCVVSTLFALFLSSDSALIYHIC